MKFCVKLYCQRGSTGGALCFYVYEMHHNMKQQFFPKLNFAQAICSAQHFGGSARGKFQCLVCLRLFPRPRKHECPAHEAFVHQDESIFAGAKGAI